MHRFFITQGINEESLIISDIEQFHHLKNVLRLKAGEEITVFDSQGNECICSIKELNKKQAVLSVKARKRAEDKKIKTTIACAIPKQARMDDIMDYLTQLGVDTIIPMETERVIVKLEPAQKDTRIERWKRLARSAAQQSQRNSVPLIGPVTSIESVISGSQDFDLKLIPTLAGETRHIKEVLAESKVSNILVLIGPEGDFTPQEIELAKNAGFIPVSLGESVLRVSTAAIAVMSYIKFSSAI
ncbi:MAG: RsmE family RNA methyltransferase [Dehalococcoidales bacterium]|nr:RsmE family RNA methyltransferase [Dehalococcoidales bacterium]